jgi:UDP-N-acetylglucosamine 2-epimerase (non-hydrolysing)
MPKVLLSMGTRPEIIKMAPVYQALSEAGFDAAVLHTGQHEEMAWPLYEFFGIPLPHVLELKRTSTSLAHLSAKLLEGVSGILEDVGPDALLVHGDTSSALMGALAAFYRQIPVAHVEAGLRTGARYDPFPEEKNRELIGRLAQWHFAPTPQATRNLRREGVAAETIHEVGNTIVDAATWGLARLDSSGAAALEMLPASLHGLPQQLAGKRLVLITAHRRENWAGGIGRIASSVRRWLESDAGTLAVWPVHGNPLVRAEVLDVLENVSPAARDRLFLCEPLNYPALLWVMRHAWVIMTDSGGIQEEALSVQAPVLVLRETTERPEVIEAGAGVLVGTDTNVILHALRRLHDDSAAYSAMRGAPNPFGDGRAAQRIAQVLNAHLRPGSKPRNPAPSPDVAREAKGALITEPQ